MSLPVVVSEVSGSMAFGLVSPGHRKLRAAGA